MEKQEKTYTKEEIKEIIEESVKLVKEGANFATENVFENSNDKQEVTIIYTTIADGMEKLLKAKFGIRPERNVVKIETKEDFKQLIVDLVDAIFGD